MHRKRKYYKVHSAAQLEMAVACHSEWGALHIIATHSEVTAKFKFKLPGPVPVVTWF